MTSRASCWEKVELSQIAEFRNGVNYTKDNFGRGVRTINVKDFQDYTTPKYDTLDEINPDGVVRDAHLLRENDIIFVRSNGNRELIGRSMMILAAPPAPVTHSAFTIRARFSSRPDIHPRFFAYVFRSGVIRQVLSAHGNGANISNLNQDILARLVVPLPPLPIQKRIASILSAYDDLIETNTRRIAILEEMARRLYEEWFVHFRFPGHEDAEFAGDLPSGWRELPLTDVARVNPESIKPAKAPQRIRYIDIASVSPGRIDGVTEMEFSDAPGRARRVVRDGDIIWSCVRPNRRSHAIVLSPAEDTIVSTGFAVLRAGSVPFSYLAAVTSQNAFVDFLTNRATGAAYPAVKQSDFEAAMIIVPSADLLVRYDRMVTPMLRMCQSLDTKNANLRAQRDLLLPKLISGEIDVSEAETALDGAAA